MGHKIDAEWEKNIQYTSARYNRILHHGSSTFVDFATFLPSPACINVEFCKTLATHITVLSFPSLNALSGCTSARQKGGLGGSSRSGSLGGIRLIVFAWATEVPSIQCLNSPFGRYRTRTGFRANPRTRSCRLLLSTPRRLMDLRQRGDLWDFVSLRLV